MCMSNHYGVIHVYKHDRINVYDIGLDVLSCELRIQHFGGT